jgi:Prenyltransferase and squalene oxidase repeat
MSGTRQDGICPPCRPTNVNLKKMENRTFFERICLPFLLTSQNTDGGWGFLSGPCSSRVEASALVLLALRECGSLAALAEPIARGCRFLHDSQLPDGAWPASPESREGCWVTALACWALLGLEEFSGSVTRGMSWLSADQPGEARWLWRTIRKLRGIDRISSQKDSCYGWSWTHGTASWVEPTSSAIIVLQSAPAKLLSAASRRMKLAEAMLYDRMCPGGGWNCGNPMVYGVPGEPQVGTTAWALLALRQHAGRSENQLSVQWLEQTWPKIQSVASLAMARLALDACGRNRAELGTAVREALSASESPWNVSTVAWASLALCGSRNWLPPGPKQ